MADFTLHHRIARPISVHHYKPVAYALQQASLIFSVIFAAVLALLLHIAYLTLRGGSFKLLLAVTFPLDAAAIILGFFIWYKTTFKRDLNYLETKFTPKLEHAFKHK